MGFSVKLSSKLTGSFGILVAFLLHFSSNCVFASSSTSNGGNVIPKRRPLYFNFVTEIAMTIARSTFKRDTTLGKTLRSCFKHYVKI